jgi:MFS family permease
VRKLAAKLRMLSPLALRDFRLLWTGMVASLLGDGVFLVAVAWQVYQLSNDPAALAAVGIATALPQVLLLLAGGVVSDRLDRRRVMITADLVRGLAIATIGALAIDGALTLTWLIALVAVYGAATAFFGPCFDAIVPGLVPSEQLTEANALDQFMRPTALRLAGPALGGAVVAITGPGYGFLIDAATFAVSAVCVGRMTAGAATRLDPDEQITLQAVKIGLRFVRSHVWLWGTFLGATASYLLFLGPTEVLLPFVVKNDLHAGARALGLVFASGGVGALLAAALTGQRDMPRRHITWMYVTWSLATLFVAGYGLAIASWQLALASFMFNGLEAAGTVWWATMKGRLVPARLLGRVSSVDWFVSTALVPLSFAFTAPIAAAYGARATLLAVGLLGSLTTLAPLLMRGMRDVEHSGIARLAGEPVQPAQLPLQ